MKKLGSFMSIVDLGLEFIDRNLQYLQSILLKLAENVQNCENGLPLFFFRAKINNADIYIWIFQEFKGASLFDNPGGRNFKQCVDKRVRNERVGPETDLAKEFRPVAAVLVVHRHLQHVVDIPHIATQCNQT